MKHSVPRVVALALSVALLGGCAASGEVRVGATAAEVAQSGHGDIAGARELAEPQPALLTVAETGDVGLLDLLTGDSSVIGSIDAPEAVASDGRYGFVSTASGIEVVDGGAWTWDHGDHFHYYRADPAIVGTIPGDGPVTVTTPQLSTTGGAGFFFAGSGEAVAVDMAALGDGEIDEWFRIETDANHGVVAPVGDAALVATADGPDAGIARLFDRSGAALDEIRCIDPAGAVTTRVGTVLGCADGAVLAVDGARGVTFERIPYPAGEPRATALAGRKNRPTVAGLSGSSAFWLLDTRERSWTRAEVAEQLVAVVAADDEAGHVVAVDDEGRVRVYAPDGTDRGATDPIGAVGATVTVDAGRAYVAGRDRVYEIDYADGARIARELTPATRPAVAVEVGR